MPNNYTDNYQVTYNGKTYNVPKNTLDKQGWDNYAQSHPGATLRMRDKNNADYDVPFADISRMQQKGGLRPYNFRVTHKQRSTQRRTAQPSNNLSQRITQRSAQRPASQSAPMVAQPAAAPAAPSTPTTNYTGPIAKQEPFKGLDVEPAVEYNQKTGSFTKSNKHKYTSEVKPTAKKQSTTPLQDAIADKERLSKMMEARMRELEQQQQDMPWWQQLGSAGKTGMGADMNYEVISNSGLLNDDEYIKLQAAYNEADRRIRNLQALQNKDGFWASLGRNLKRRDLWDNGITDFTTGLGKLRAKTDPKNDKSESTQELLKQEAAADAAEQQADQELGDAARWGRMAAESASYTPYFIQFGGIMNVASKAGAKAATNIAERLGAKGLMRAVTKGTGKVLGDVGGSLGLTVGPQALRTSSDAIDRYVGHVDVDDDGNFTYTGGKGAGRSVYEGIANSTIENFTELVFDGMPGVADIARGGLAKLGLKGASRWIDKATGSQLYKASQKMLRRAGVGNLTGEIAEEEINIPLNALFVGDNSFSDLLDKDQQKDIVGGVALSTALMHGVSLAAQGAGRGLSAAAYARYMHNLNKADSKAAELIGDEWEGMKESLDQSTNDEWAKALSRITDRSDLTDEQKIAAVDYANRLVQQRGYNLGQNAASEKGLQNPVEQSASEAYLNGMEENDPSNLSKIVINLNNSRKDVAEKLGINEDEVDDELNDPVNYMNTHPNADKQAIVNYANGKAAYDGMIQQQKYRIDDAVSQNENLIDSHTNKDTGMITRASLKAKDDSGNDKQVYIIGGTVNMMEDGSGIDKDKSSGSVIVIDENGEQSMISPIEILSLDAPIDPEEEKRVTSDAIREQIASEFETLINSYINQPATEQATKTYNPGDELTINDESGNPIGAEIISQADENGRYLVRSESPINGNVVNSFTADEINNLTGVQQSSETPVEEQPANMAPAVQENENSSVPESKEAAPVMESVEDNTEQAAVAEPSTATPLEPATQEPSALSRIPIDENGEPAYEQADAETAWDAIMEQTEGDENDAREVINSMIADKENELKKLEKSKPKAGTTISQKIAAQKEHKAVVQQARDALKKWQDIAAIPDRRASMAREEAQKAAKAEAEARRIAAETEKAKQEEEARKQREALNGVPDYVQDTPTDARARGYRRVNGEKIDRQEPISAPMGKEIEVKFSDNEKPKGRVAVIDSAQLQPSHLNATRNPLHFIDEAQPKERNDEASRLAAQKIASDIRPEEITSSTTAYTGAPTVNTRGEVIQGNNRSIALRDMWAEYPEQAAKYKQYLMDHAQDYGLNADDIANMDNPVLVNMIDVPDDQAIQLGQYVAQDTESGGVERIKPQNAVRKIGKDMNIFAGLLLNSNNDETTFSELLDANGLEALKWLNKKGIITDTQYKSAFDSKGNINAEAKNDLKGIMYQGIFQNGNTHLEEMFGTLPAKAQRAILATAYRDYDSPQNERLVPEIQQSIMAYYALQQYESFAQAKNYKEAMMAVQDWSRQAAFDDVTGESYLPSERYSNFALLLATMYKGQTQTFIQNTLKKIFDLVQGTQETTLFDEPDNTPRSLVEAINETLSSLSDELLLNENFIYNGQLRNHVLAGSGATSQPRGQGSVGSTTSGGRTESGTGTNGDNRRTENDSVSSRDRKYGRENQSRTEEGKNAKERLTKEEAAGIIADMEKRAETAPEIELNIENWDALFGADGRVNTPLGEVKMGENQFAKLMRQGRNGKLGMIKPTLKNPDIIIEDKSQAKKGDNTERPSSYIFVKTFVKADGSRYYYFASITVSKEGREVVVSSQEKSRNRILRLMLEGSVIWRTPKDATTSSAEKQGLDYAHPNEAEDATKGSGITPQSTSSFRKDSEKSHLTNKLGEKIAEAEEETNTAPTEAQKEAGNYKKGHVRIDGYDVTIEQPKGSIRRGKDKNGKAWESKMHYTYGYLRGTEGVDGDHIDVFLSDDPSTGNVFVVDQVDPETGAFDEHKVMYGFDNEEEAREAYLSNYERGWKGLGNITEVSKDEFKKWIQSSKRKTKPFSEYKIAKKQSDSTTNKTSEYNAPDEKDAIKDLEQEKKTTAEKIGDVGEKIGGAKKDRIKEYAQKIKNIDSDKSSFLKEIVQLPISKIFNFPYDKLRSEGLSNELISMLQTIRKIIPSKPRTKYKLERWASNVFYLYRFSLEVVSSGKDFQQKFLDGANNINGISALYRAYIELGGYDSHLDTGMAGLEELGESAGRYDKEGNWVSLKGQWWLKNAGKHSGIYKTLDEARTNLRKFASENSRTNDKSQTEFSVYSRIKEGDFFITVKGKPNVVVESGFKTSKEAFNYIKEHYDELVSKYTSIKNDTSVNFRENRKRTGKDWRDGKDITAEEFKDTFGFRGVEFGNWTNQEERQQMINNAYDAFMDLSEAIGKSPRALSLNGELAMAFGSRGGGKAMAHYEPGKIVINLTKTNGAGSLAHEWWHALDNYFSRRRGDKLGYNSNREGYRFDSSTRKMRNPDERGEITDAFTDLMSAIEKSGYGKRSRNYASLKSSYWSKPTELGARAFAVWIERKLAENGISNDFLVNNPIIWDNYEVTDKYYPYPMESDFESLDTAFDNLFNAIQEKTDKQTGKTILFNISDIDNVHMTEDLQAVYDTVIGMLDDAGIEVEILSNDEMEKMAGRGDASLKSKKKSAPETDSSLQDEEHQHTAISSTEGTKILNNLDSLAKEYENSPKTEEKTFIGEVAKALDIKRTGASSRYATFETANGQTITIRLSNHNATVSNFDKVGEAEGISIVVSPKKNPGVRNDGSAHIVEYYYDAIKLRKADGKPLAEIVRSIKQALYSGEYTDTTGLAQRQEVNESPADNIRGGIVYGATVDGKIYLNGNALNPETPIHEYTHIWDAACQKKNPELWKRGVELMKQTPMWNEVKNDPNYADLQTDYEIASEVHSRLTGSDGTARMERMVSEARKNGAEATAEAVNLRERLKKWLSDFWYWLKDTMTPWTKEEAKRVSLEDFINMPLKDLAQRTYLNGNGITIEKSRTEENENELNTANKRFNDELDAFKAQLHKGLLHLGKPGKKLKACGIDTELTLSPTVLSRKLKQHGLDIDDIKDLAKAIQDPILVYQHGDVHPNIVVVTDLTAKNGKISVAVELNEEGNVVELNNISSIHNKDATTELERLGKMRNGYLEHALRWVDKNKVSDWLGVAGLNSPIHVNNPKLISVANILESFENPNIEDENLREGNGSITDNELSYENDPIAKVIGKSTRSAKQRKAFAERERRNMITTLQVLSEKLKLNNVEIVTDASTLSGRKARAKGFYSRDTGKITIVIPNHTSVQDAVQTLLHEAVAHYGLRKLFGENFDNFLDNVFNNAEPDVRERIVNLASKRGWDFRTATEEYLASLAENTNFENIDPSWWMRIKQFFLDMLNKLGLKGFNQVPLSDNELRYILWRSYQNLSHPEYYNTIFGEAEDIAKQNELKVGNYAPTEIQAQTVAEESIVDTNRRFNEELRQQIDGNLPKGHVYELGRPGRVLRSTGIPDLPIELAASRLGKKASKDYESNHPFELESVMDLPKAIQHPIAVFESKTKAGSKVIMVELKDRNGNNFVVAMNTNVPKNRFSKASIQINDIRSIYPKDNVKDIVNWINRGDLLRYADKKKIEDWITQQRSNSAEVEIQNLDVAAKVVENFKNPNIEEENNNLLFRDGDETSPLSGSTIDAWDKLANSFKFQLRETSVDYLTAVEKFQQLIEKSSGKKIQDYENAYDYMTILSSKNRQEMDMFDSFIVKPINKAISNLVGKKHTFGKWTWEKGPLRELVMYVEAKHGTDRNRQMAVENSINDFKAPNLEFFENAGIGFDMNVYKQELEEAGKTAYDAAYEKAREKMNEETPEAEENAKKKAELAELRAKEVFADKKMQQLNEQYREKQYNDWMQAKETINSTEGLSWKDKQDMLDEEAHKLNADLLRDYSGLSSVFGDKEKYPSGWLESAKNYVTEYESSHPEENIKQLWNTIGNATRYALEKQYETGLVSADYVRRQRQRFDNYIPLRGFEDEIAGDVYKYIGSEFYPGSNPVKTAHGRTSEAGNPFGSILNTAYSSISVGNKNMAKMAFYSLVVNHDTGGLAVVNRAWMVKYDALKNDPELEDLLVTPQSDGNEETTEWVEAVPKMADGLTASEMKDVLDRFDKAMKKGQREEITKPIGKKANIAYRTLYKERNEHDIPLFISGDKYVITITGNPRVAQSMNGLLNPDVDENGLAQMAKKIQQFMAGAFTSKNAAFSIANLAKDTIYSNNQTFIRENPLYWLKFTINQKAGFGAYPKMMEMLFKYQRGTLDVSKKIERDFYSFMKNGGATGYTFVNSQEEYARELSKKLKEISKNTSISHKAKKVIQSFFDLVEFAGQSAELVNRFAAYQTSRQMGRSVNRAIRDAKEITVNFNRKGAGRKTVDKNKPWYSPINILSALSQYGRTSILFWNANMQAKYRFYLNMKEHPIKTSATLIGNSMAFAAVLLPLINNLLLPALYSAFGLGGDDDDDDYFNALTDWERTHNMCVRLPNGNWLKVPLSPEMTPWFTMGDAIGGQLSGQRDFSSSDFIKSSIDAVSPLSINWSYGNDAKILLNILPTVSQPILQNMMNVNFMGNPIKKTPFNYGNSFMPEFLMTYRSASPSLVELSRLSNLAGGGTEKKTSGNISDWNPSMLQNLITGYTGGFGQTFLSAADWIVNTSKGESQAITFSRMPLASRFFISGNKDVKISRINSRYYDVRDFLDEFEFDKRSYEKSIQESERKHDMIDLARNITEYQQLMRGSRAVQYVQLKEYDNAIRQYERYLKLFPDDEVSMNQYNTLKAQAVKIYDEMKQKNNGK